MKKSLVLGLIFLVIGLILGYIIFGQVNGKFISIQNLLGLKKGFFQGAYNYVTNIEKIRMFIALCGLGGFGAGFVVGLVIKK